MTTYFEAPDGHGEPCLWAPNPDYPDLPLFIVRASSVRREFWPDVVARMTGTTITNEPSPPDGAGIKGNNISAFDLPTGSVVATKSNVYIKNARYKTWSGFMQNGHASHDIQSCWIEGQLSDGLATVLRVGVRPPVDQYAIAELIARHAGEIADGVLAALTGVPHD
jgi:hypothetical protein